MRFLLLSLIAAFSLICDRSTVNGEATYSPACATVAKDSLNFVTVHPNKDNPGFKSAYIIAKQDANVTILEEHSRLIGFVPTRVAAFVPSEEYRDFHTIADYCLDHHRDRRDTWKLSIGEYALICSHRLVWDIIANDMRCSDDDWSIVFESDAQLVPSIEGDEARKMVDKVLYESNAYKYGFVYLGLCGPSRCTHAYAVIKSFAASFFTNIYCPKSYQHQVKCYTLQTDAAFEKYFFLDRKDHPYLIGYQYLSPQNVGHTGLFYQHRDTNYYEKYKGGTTLTKNLNETYEVNYKFCYSHKWRGRLGNLMFQYASLLGLCVLHNYPLHSCIGISPNLNSYNEEYLPIKKFLSTFRIPHVYCTQFDQVYTEHEQNINDVKYDSRIALQEGGTNIVGYLQSFKYFHPHAAVLVKRTFTFHTSIMFTVDDHLEKVKKQTGSDQPLICVAVRRGDKVNLNFYNQWAISADYYIRAINQLTATYPVLNNSELQFFVGGSFGANETDADKSWAETNIISQFKGRKTFTTPSHISDVESLYRMSLCEYMVVGSSSFSWWGAYLSANAKVIAPGSLHEGFNKEDYYLPEWTVLEQEE